MTSASAPNSQGLYSPLPCSDSDSEDEVFSKTSELSKVINAALLVQRENGSADRVDDHSRNGKITIAGGLVMPDYCPLHSSETSLNGYGQRGRCVVLPNSPSFSPGDKVETTPVEVKQQIGWSNMSRLRKGCFIFSLLLCVFAAFGFLWILPCDLDMMCPQSTMYSFGHSTLTTPGAWEALLPGVEVTSTPSLVGSYVILTVRGSQPLFKSHTPSDVEWKKLGYGPFLPNSSSAGGGVIALWRSNGTCAWASVVPGEAPEAINCNLIDATKDGKNDCLLNNPNWLLAALDPSSKDKLLWILHVHNDNSSPQSENKNIITDSQQKPARIFFPPVKIIDVDNDGVPDLCALASPQKSLSLDSFMLVSGRRGNIIGRLVNISGCVSMTDLQLDEADNTLTFTCINQAGAESLRIMSVQELHHRATNSTQQNPAMLSSSHKHQPTSKLPFEKGRGDGNIFSIQTIDLTLSMENRGSCPQCSVSVTLFNHDSNTTLWNYNMEAGRAMSAVALHFPTPFKSKGTGSGSSIGVFVLKFWLWPLSTPKSPKFNTASRKSNESFGRKHASFNNHWIKTNIDIGEEDISSSPDIQVLRLKERVVIITFNGTELHIINASQSDVIQLCATMPLTQGYHMKNVFCQPDMIGQENSLLIADLDSDNTQELISFTSTFSPLQQPTNEKDASVSWELVSKVKVIHLETELSKLV